MSNTPLWRKSNWDNYDKEVKFRTSEKPRHINHRPKRPDVVKYTPPYRHEQTHEQTQGQTDEQTQGQTQGTQEEEEDDDMPKRLFTFEFEDKDGQIYKQYVNEGVTAAVLAMRMGHDRKLPSIMMKVLEQRLQEEIDKRTPGKGS